MLGIENSQSLINGCHAHDLLSSAFLFLLLEFLKVIEEVTKLNKILDRQLLAILLHELY
jgi:hypothetical protein